MKTRITPHQIWVAVVGGTCIAMLAGLLGALFVIASVQA